MHLFMVQVMLNEINLMLEPSIVKIQQFSGLSFLRSIINLVYTLEYYLQHYSVCKCEVLIDVSEGFRISCRDEIL
jgi:hypothetical protein